MLELIAVTRQFEGRRVLGPLDLRVEPGERVVLFGRSGCGKTTALRIIAGLTPPDNGQVILNGQIVSEPGRVILPPERRGIGYVFQDLALWPHMTIAANIEFPLKVRGVPAAERQEQTMKLLGLLELPNRASAFPANLSGGEQQRVAIARALAGSPRAVLMDEPMANLDDELRHTLSGVLLRLQEKLGFAIVAVTHRNDEIAMLSARRVAL